MTSAKVMRVVLAPQADKGVEEALQCWLQAQHRLEQLVKPGKRPLLSLPGGAPSKL